MPCHVTVEMTGGGRFGVMIADGRAPIPELEESTGLIKVCPGVYVHPGCLASVRYDDTEPDEPARV